jgi:hypothetical protein
VSERTQERLDRWWRDSLSDEDRTELLRLATGDELPRRFLTAELIRALGLHINGFTLRVPARLGDFLATKRRDGS